MTLEFYKTDAKGTIEIVICKRHAKGVYDYKEENIIYRLKATASPEYNPVQGSENI